MKYCMIEVAFGIKKEANKAVDELLNKRLVASCQIIAFGIGNKNENKAKNI